MSVFEEQAKFMLACGQTVGVKNEEQTALYVNLIMEEMAELFEAVAEKNKAEIFDALLDIIVVCIGAGHSAGFPMNEGWKEVIRSNMAKVDPETGFVKKRADGKILKPEGWTPPDLASLIEE
jgi:predicted HAD superfamily Cof-like phosphohydrolase